MTIKILHVIGTVDPASGGPIEGIKQQQKILTEDKIANIEIVSLDNPDAPYLKNFQIKVHAQGSNNLKLHNKTVSWLHPIKRYGYTPKIIPWLTRNAQNYDLIIVNGLWNYSTYSASRALKKCKTPYVVYTHGMLDPWFRRTYPLKYALKCISWLLCEHGLLKGASAVLFTAEEERLLSHGSFWGHTFVERVVGYGTHEPPPYSETQKNAFLKAVPELHGRRYLLFLSRIHPKKGCDLLIRAFARIASQFPDVDLVIAGPDQVGIKQQLQSEAKDLAIASRIHWPGLLQGDAKYGAYRMADAMVLPSHQENFGIVVAEALACAIPVLITNKVNIWREVQAGGGGLIANDDIDDITKMLTRFLSMPKEERALMGDAALRSFKQKFDITVACKTLVDIIQNKVLQT